MCRAVDLGNGWGPGIGRLRWPRRRSEQPNWDRFGPLDPKVETIFWEKMPKVKRSRKAPPDGWELIEPTLDELDQKMREAETEPHEGKRKVESLALLHCGLMAFPRLFAELYEYCIKEGYADKNLIAKWKKQGYENLCCLRCIQTRDTNFGTNCICRVPKSKLEVLPQHAQCLSREGDSGFPQSPMKAVHVVPALLGVP
ncbi:hypothetical protein E5288_WYG008513 [Bos mutus]|uniref:Protein BUD31 homolog n=1 Tax=Bos mutus TaxID=72004 RepID=A0A6B0RWZ1_9CETA|nr:hypothetical protein [Bos mutus]